MATFDTWLEEYCVSLDNRDAQEQAVAPIISSYENLAHRHGIARLEAHASQVTEPIASEEAISLRIPPVLFGAGRSAPVPPESEALKALRSHLAAAQRSKSDLDAKVAVAEREVSAVQDSLLAVKSELQLSTKKITRLEILVTTLQRRLRDRESELKEKARLVEQVQDEHVGLEMQVNVAEQRRKDVEAENRELVERYKERVRQEVEQMNRGFESR